MKTKYWYVQMSFRVLMHKYGNNVTFQELKDLGVI